MCSPRRYCPCELIGVGGPQVRELPQQLHQTFAGDGGHAEDQEPAGQNFVYFPGAGVGIVHGGDEAGGLFPHILAAVQISGYRHPAGQAALCRMPGALKDVKDYCTGEK